MKLIVREHNYSKDEVYYISHYDPHYGDIDSEIAYILDISLDEYRSALIKFGAKEVDNEYFDSINGFPINVLKKASQMYFFDEKDAIKCAEYLNEIYLTTVKLRGVRNFL